MEEVDGRGTRVSGLIVVLGCQLRYSNMLGNQVERTGQKQDVEEASQERGRQSRAGGGAFDGRMAH